MECPWRDASQCVREDPQSGHSNISDLELAAGSDPDRPMVPLPERVTAEATLAEAILDLADVACKTADELRALIAAHGTQAGLHLPILQL